MSETSQQKTLTETFVDSAAQSAVPEMTDERSSTINLVRPLAILFMTLVHVNPGLAIYEGVETVGLDWLRYIKVITAGIIGKTSVPLLSIVSGYLAVSVLKRASYQGYVVSRFKTLYVPMAVWNVVGLVTAALAASYLGVVTTSYETVQDQSLLRMVLSSVFALDNGGYTIALNFLRDLFLVSLFTPVLIKVSRSKMGTVVAVALMALSAMDLTAAPVIYRLTIASFFYLGIYLSINQQLIRVVEQRWRPLAVVTLLTASVVFAQQVGWWETAGSASIEVTSAELLLRLLMAASLWNLCSWLVRKDIRFSRTTADATYLFFLSHVFLFGLLWVGWERLVSADATQAIYLVFYFVAPVATFGGIVVASRMLNYFPAAVQILLRGKKKPRKVLDLR